MPTLPPNKQLLLIGASRGLGLALAEEYLKRGWHVVATERDSATSKLHDLLRSARGRLEIATVRHAVRQCRYRYSRNDRRRVDRRIHTGDGDQRLESHAHRREHAGSRV